MRGWVWARFEKMKSDGVGLRRVQWTRADATAARERIGLESGPAINVPMGSADETGAGTRATTAAGLKMDEHHEITTGVVVVTSVADTGGDVLTLAVGSRRVFTNGSGLDHGETVVVTCPTEGIGKDPREMRPLRELDSKTCVEIALGR